MEVAAGNDQLLQHALRQQNHFHLKMMKIVMRYLVAVHFSTHHRYPNHL
jgi:hypothetical protein